MGKDWEGVVTRCNRNKSGEERKKKEKQHQMYTPIGKWVRTHKKRNY